jgi:16S rRNA (adenine1518-N6/adenine1519-N6)-dimethyltransferase
MNFGAAGHTGQTMSRSLPPPLRKSLGQHHLIRPEACTPLLDYLQPQGHRVVEVGPGGGVLTGLLLASARAVDVIEMDSAWAFFLSDLYRQSALRIVTGDALDIRWERLAPGSLVTGNLPYQISTALVERLLPLAMVVPRAAFLVQREVAERLVALPGSSAYGSLSVLVNACSDCEVLGYVARGSFRPPPKVEGAFVGLRLRPPPFDVCEFPRFAKTVREAFALRRKTLRNSLATAWGKEDAERVLAELGLDSRVRAESLDRSAFLELHAWRSARSS